LSHRFTLRHGAGFYAWHCFYLASVVGLVSSAFLAFVLRLRHKKGAIVGLGFVLLLGWCWVLMVWGLRFGFSLSLWGSGCFRLG
jgi:CHASE2 domain-containing sensor protein